MMAAKTTAPVMPDPTDAQTAAAAREDAMMDLLEEQSAKIKALEEQIAASGNAKAAAKSKAQELTEQFDSEAAALADEFADYPAISMVTRRIVDGVAASYDIRLKRDADMADEGQRYWSLRWFNLGRENRAQEMTDRGWVKVRWDELQNVESVAGSVQQDEFVRRGDRGLEVLAKMPRKLFDHLKRREAAVAAGLLTSESGLRGVLANTTASAVGQHGGNADQAGSLIAGKNFVVEVSEGPKERFTA